MAFGPAEPSPLRAEAQAYAAAMTFPLATQLRRLGADMPAVGAAGLVGVVYAAVATNDRWSAAEDGRLMVTAAAEEQGGVVDIVAFDPTRPDEWFLRTGNAWALGMDAIDEARLSWRDNTLFLSATPLDWLRAGMRGACVIDWTLEAIATLRDAVRIEVADSRFARALRLELSRPPRIPEIGLASRVRNAA